MNKEQYIKRIEYIKNRPLLCCIIKACYYVIPYIIGIIYLIVIISKIADTKQVIGIICGPAIAFIVVSVFRKLLNAKRPYEVYQYPPLLPKNKAGESFPSRHALSAFAIASACVDAYTLVGIATFVLATIVAITRFLTGVHFAKDVIAGAIAGIAIVELVILFLGII